MSQEEAVKIIRLIKSTVTPVYSETSPWPYAPYGYPLPRPIPIKTFKCD